MTVSMIPVSEIIAMWFLLICWGIGVIWLLATAVVWIITK